MGRCTSGEAAADDKKKDVGKFPHPFRKIAYYG